MKVSYLFSQNREQDLNIDQQFPWIAILGNPNCGKTALFNRLTGMHLKVGNYPGVTVERKSGFLRNTEIELRDLPGTYSLNARSLDEKIVTQMVNQWSTEKNAPSAVLVVIDANNLSRNLFLSLQLLEYGIPTILALNMMDEVEKRGLVINVDQLQKDTRAFAVLPVSAKTGDGFLPLERALGQAISHSNGKAKNFMHLTDPEEALLKPMLGFFRESQIPLKLPLLTTVLNILNNRTDLRDLQLSADQKITLAKIKSDILDKTVKAGVDLVQLESDARYQWIDRMVRKSTSISSEQDATFSEKVDGLLTHPVWGIVILLVILSTIFNAVFSWAEYPMAVIESAVAWLSATVGAAIPAGIINSLITDSIIAGVGNVIVFLPQIILLVFFISVLEDSGYMSRMAFLLEKLMKKVGLSGKAVLPMLSGFACAIPAIMASRTIENWRDRLVTIMLIPLLSCSARLPVYTLLIAAFVPSHTVWGIFQLQSLVLMSVYFLGFFTAIIASLIIKKISHKKEQNRFLLELPPYRWPMVRSVSWKVWHSAKLFLINAGSIILALSIVLWFLASYPKSEQTVQLNGADRVEQSYVGQLGHAIEPLIRPLGFDWKIGIGLVSSFAAREVLVSSFATIYNVSEEDGENVPLVEALRNDRLPDGSLRYSPLIAISLLVFFVYAAQCMSTFAIIRRETNSWRWPIIMLLYMNVLAYMMSFLVFQGGKLLGVA